MYEGGGYDEFCFSFPLPLLKLGIFFADSKFNL